MNRLLLACVLTLAACGSEAALTEAPASPIVETTSPIQVPTDPPVAELQVSAPELVALTTEPSPLAATVHSTPDRGTQIQVATTLPPPSAAEVCNSMDYYAYANGADQPAALCYRAVAAEQGWDVAKIAAWQPFLITEFSGVIQGESSSCWNLRGGDRIAAGENCLNVRRTSSPGDDTGWGQATRSLWGSNAFLCKTFGVCSWQQIIESPYSSMLNSVIRVVDYNGSQPWCFAGWARDYHQCWEAPDR